MSKINPKLYLIAAVAATTIGLVLSSQPVSAQVTVFSDNFAGGSTIDQPLAPPTATSTSYEAGMGSTNNASVAIVGANDLNMTFPNTSSVLGEIQALFTSSPLTLVNSGDYVDLTVTYVDTLRILNSGDTSSQLDMGLFNSGLSGPQQGLTLYNSVNSPTGGAKNWLGYSSKVIDTGTAQILARPAQTSATSAQNQELLFNNASSAQAYNSPTGLVVATKGSTLTTNAMGQTYTDYLRITLTGVNTLSVTSAVYNGVGTGGLQIFGLGGSASNVTYLTSTFDGLAFGWRFSGTQTNSQMDISSITVTTNTVPEPSSLMLAGAGLGLMIAMIRRRRS